MWQSIRKVLWGIVLILICVNIWCHGSNYGYAQGYGDAMADVLLQKETPEGYFTKRFDIRIPAKVQHTQEHNE